ncbi:thymidine phosphorylase [Dethiosulfatibacter aminovorans DSM 17477]|uniref:Pyrimidine-nucleoside phosphorylase n=1 Tax=Dethiosulfatibacter aminovorans DSM 17477 TaxID=1121476 RepID=A0A1M6DA43_9FIRM|nr:thymidine phosphorylase [Dethiosulfatibacter aminovorans]SHI70025.1 thymidine phosphorylase [Dethiosulfatibacter aminovorans DSM 17477]
MRVYDLITKKKHGEKLSKDEINHIIEGYVSGDIPDYQISSLLMAIYFQGMDLEETINLTEAMINSGDVVDLSHVEGITADKHSTGGVGDKTSLALLPLMASCGLKVSKMSGRGLGHTGGTLDKLESIPGFNINLSKEEMSSVVNSVGFAIAGQTANLVPADKKLYALRDVTATVDNMSLIASSIMSKKIASGADNIMLDVKIGSGAFMKDIGHAVELAETMVSIGRGFNRNVGVVLTNMEEPLGMAVGNSLEVIEAVNTLKGNGPGDFTELCIFLNSAMLKLTGIVSDIEDGKSMTMEALESGSALHKFREFVSAQGGDVSYIDETDRFESTKYSYEMICPKDGYIEAIDAEKIGICSLMTGAGRETKESDISYSAGILLHKKTGSRVEKGEILGVIYTDREGIEGELRDMFMSSYKFSSSPTKKKETIIGLVDQAGFTDLRRQVGN